MAINRLSASLIAGAVLVSGPLLLTSCSRDDDRIVVCNRYTWIDRSVAVVAPLDDPLEKARLERTATWMLDNFRDAQLSGDVCVRINLQWYDENSENLEELAGRLSEDDGVAAIIGPFTSDHMVSFANICQQNGKPLIAPTITSDELIRRYAVPTKTGNQITRPFFWSLTETDVAFSEVILSAQAALNQQFRLTSEGILLSPDNLDGQTFFNWTPFQAENLGVRLVYNRLYNEDNDFLTMFRDALDYESGQKHPSANFCVISDIHQMVDAMKLRRLLFQGQSEKSVVDSLRTYFAFSRISQEDIDQLSSQDRLILENAQGFAPYADPTTGFEISYEERFGVRPTLSECKFYDGLMLAAFAIYKITIYGQDMEGQDPGRTPNEIMNDAIYDICFPNSVRQISATVWRTNLMKLYLESLRSGQFPMFRGASGNIGFDTETCSPASGTFYIHWQIVDGKIQILNYFSSEGNHRVGPATAAWRFFYDENTAQKRFALQASDDNTSLTYPALTDQYAVLVHASEGFGNYRHLADVLNIYQHLRRGGFDDDHIILIADPSIAYSKYNPEPGTIRTSPDSPDLMVNAVIDYDASLLTAYDISQILMGCRSDRLDVVVPSNPGHNVFLYWSGHGHSRLTDGTDEFQWRRTPVGDGFTRQMMLNTVKQMHDSQAYRKLLIVAEPCYAESVVNAVDGIPGVLAMTGANSNEQSWADHWNKEGSFWMSDRFSSNLAIAVRESPAITYRDLYLYCAQHTLGSHACIVNAANFGNLYHSGPAEFVIKQK